MMNLKEEIKIERIKDNRYDNGLIKLNMPVKELFDIIKPDLFEFYSKLEEVGIKLDAPIIASEQDTQDYLNIENKDSDYTDYEHSLVNVLINTVYFDDEFIDPETSMHGLIDCNGKIVVPPLFESCKGTYDISTYQTLAVVKQNGKFWLTPRDGSGRIVTETGYDKISRSFCYGWVERDGKVGLIDSRLGKILIPCEMDWLDSENNAFYYLYGKDGKIGIADTYDPDNVWSLSPVYDEINIEKELFRLNGVWGWISHDRIFHPGDLKSPNASIFRG